MKKNNKNLKIGDFVKEKSFSLRRRVGQITAILQDSTTNPSLECILVNPKTLLPVENLLGQHKVFKIKRNNSKYYVSRQKLFEKKSFEIGGYISHKGKVRTKYGRIICYLNQEEGLYPHSYDIKKHNGKDLLECVEIDPNNLKRILDEEDHPKIFIAYPDKCKVTEVLDTDENGEQVIAFKLVV
jgi:hypothetical protein